MKLLMKQVKVIEFEVGANGMKKGKKSNKFSLDLKKAQNVTLNMKD